MFDPARVVLLDSDGKPVRVRPQTLRVLEHLHLSGGRLVTREELFAQVWPGVVVTDDSLVQCVGEIRRAIGDERHEILLTVPRRGYRLEICEAALSDAPAAQPATNAADPGAGGSETQADLVDAVPGRNAASGWRPPRKLILFAGAAVLVMTVVALALWGPKAHAPLIASFGLGDRPPLAVLSFRVEDGDEATSALGAGLAEDLISDLARDIDLKVISARSSFALDTRKLSASEIARRLGVRYLIDGTVRREPQMLRVRVQLIDGNDGRVVWTDVRESRAENLAEHRRALLARVAGSIETSMRWHQKRQALSRAPASLDVYALTLRAYALKHRFTAQATRAARSDLDLALRMDPNHAPAWVVLGYVNTIDAAQRLTGEWSSGRVGEALAQIDRGIALDSELSLAYQARAAALGALRRHDEALAAAQRAVELAPGDPDNLAILAKAQNEAGRSAEALRTMERALSLYPIEPAYVSAWDANILWANGLHSRSLAKADACIASAPKFLGCHSTRASTLWELGRHAEARAAADVIRGMAPNATAETFAGPLLGTPRLGERRLAVAAELGFEK